MGDSISFTHIQGNPSRLSDSRDQVSPRRLPFNFVHSGDRPTFALIVLVCSWSRIQYFQIENDLDQILTSRTKQLHLSYVMKAESTNMFLNKVYSIHAAFPLRSCEEERSV